MNKKFTFITIQLIIWIVLAAILLGITVSAFSDSFSNKIPIKFGIGFSFGEADNLQYEKEFDSDNIQNISINLRSQSIEILPYSGSTVKVQYFTSANKKTEDITAEISNDTLNIKSSNNIRINFLFALNEKIVISVPSSQSYNYNVAISSGSVKANDVYIKNFNAEITSGSVKISSLGKSDSINIKTTSGSVDSSLNADKVFVKTNSGSIKLHGEMEVIETKATSGSIKLYCQNQPQSLSANVTSGSVKLYLPESISGFTYKGSITSGSAYEGFGKNKMSGAYTFGDGAIDITANITSGSVKILPLE